MARAPRLLVVNVSLTGPERDYDTTVTFLHRRFRLVRVGTAGDVAAAEGLVRSWASRADAIAVTGLREARAVGLYDGELDAIDRVKRATNEVPVSDGHELGDVLQEWAIRHLQTELPGYLTNARTVVLGGLNHQRTTRLLREYTDNIEFADPLLRFDLPAKVAGNPLLSLAAGTALWPVHLLPGVVKSQIKAPGTRLSHALARRAARDADVVVATYDELVGFGLEDLAGKTLISSAISDERLADLGDRGVDMVLDSVPQPFPVTVTAAVLEAMMQALVGGGRLTHDDLLDMIVEAGMEPRVLYPNGFRRKSRFAFVIHPLSQKFFNRVEPLGTITRLSPGVVNDVIEKALAYAPPFTYSHVTGITSPTGAEAEGWLISVGGTPKELMAHSPEFTYGRLLQAADMARKLGAQVMGLGAFTKVVGDAGVTVAKKASLPVTTGNSYSASGALWAAHEAVRRLGIAEVDDRGRIHGRVMVIGATGAIGSVCSRLLALASDEIWLVSPETAKLLALKHDIERDHPRATVHLASHARGAPRRHGRDRHGHVRRRQARARHHGGQARVRDHRCGTAAGPVGGGRRQASRRAGRGVRGDRAARRRTDEEHRAAARRRLRLHGRDRRPGPGGALRDLHRRAEHRVGEGQGDLPARAQARHEARGDLRRQRGLHRRAGRGDPGARARGPGRPPPVGAQHVTFVPATVRRAERG